MDPYNSFVPVAENSVLLWEARIDGRVPSKKNSRQTVVRGPLAGRSFPSKDHQSWHRQCVQRIGREVPAMPFKEARVFVHIYFPDLRRADVTNKAESVLDLLQDIGVIKDDAWTCIGAPILSCSLDRARPGFHCRVEAIA